MPITLGTKHQQINTADGIREAFDSGIGVRVNTGTTWTFPTRGADGCVGKLCVSKLRTVDVPGAAQQLAIHVTFTIRQIWAPKVTSDEHMRVEIKNLHYTARPLSLQLEIGDENAVAHTPSGRVVSIHRGVNNAWPHTGWLNADERLKAIAGALGLDGEGQAIKDALTGALADYSGLALGRVKTALPDCLRTEIKDGLMPAAKRDTVVIDIDIS